MKCLNSYCIYSRSDPAWLRRKVFEWINSRTSSTILYMYYIHKPSSWITLYIAQILHWYPLMRLCDLSGHTAEPTLNYIVKIIINIILKLITQKIYKFIIWCCNKIALKAYWLFCNWKNQTISSVISKIELAMGELTAMWLMIMSKNLD